MYIHTLTFYQLVRADVPLCFSFYWYSIFRFNYISLKSWMWSFEIIHVPSSIIYPPIYVTIFSWMKLSMVDCSEMSAPSPTWSEVGHQYLWPHSPDLPIHQYCHILLLKLIQYNNLSSCGGQLTRITECERSTQLFEREHLSETTKMDLKIGSYVQHKIQVL